MQRTNKFAGANDDYEFVEGWGQVDISDFGKHFNLTPGTYILVVETQVYDESPSMAPKDAFGNRLSHIFMTILV